jgi:hypothetical protein
MIGYIANNAVRASRIVTPPLAPLAYRLEPPDHIIAELQSSVVRCRQARERTRDELVDDRVAAAREVAEGRDPHAAVGLAALAILLRMEAAA